MNTGKKLFNRRKELGLTLEQVGKIVGVSKSTVRKWETGDIENMRRDKIALLSKALKVSPAFIMGWDNDSLILSDTYQPSHLYKIPIYGTIQAGPPMFAAENIEGYEFADVPTPDDYFYLRVKGDSMINARIQDGDIVLVHRQSYADNGQIVACVVNGDEATLKRFRRLDTSIMLQPDNPSYDPIIVPLTDFDNGYAKVLGVVERVMFSVI